MFILFDTFLISYIFNAHIYVTYILDFTFLSLTGTYFEADIFFVSNLMSCLFFIVEYLF